MKYAVFVFLDLVLFSILAFPQENYEIQVYGSETLFPKATMLELHSNYTFGGSKTIENGVFPSHHILHETVEITHGFNDWLEIGFYFFNAIGDAGRTGFVGSHIRPRVRAPKKWNLPVGLSLSIEGGYQRLEYSEDDWSIEIRPIIDKTFGKLYFSLNPSVDKSLHGLNSDKGFSFSPNVKSTYDVSKIMALGLEYYGSVGSLFKFLPSGQQQHQLFVVADIDFSPDWELNFGYGIGFTKATDNGIAKIILGYRFR